MMPELCFFKSRCFLKSRWGVALFPWLVLTAAVFPVDAQDSADGDTGKPASVQKAEPLGGNYACWGLQEALEDLQLRFGLKLLWSSDVVHGEMQIKEPAEGDDALELLDQVLAPFELEASPVEGGEILLIVPSDPRRRLPVATPSAGPSEAVERLLPDWLDKSSQPVSWSFPSRSKPRLRPGDRTLIVRLDTAALSKIFEDDFVAAAFYLKEILVALGAERSGLRVALEGPRQPLERLVAEGLAPYIHAYVQIGAESSASSRSAELSSHVPPLDPSARGWGRSQASAGPEILGSLLEAAKRGDQLVIFEQARIDPLHHAFLRYLQGIEAADLGRQPQIAGVAVDQARFFLDPVSGDRYLALYLEPTENEKSRRLELEMAHFRSAQRLFPSTLTEPELGLEKTGDRVVVHLPMDSPYQLLRLRSVAGSPHRDLEVAAKALVDPYELVVANQVFQRRQLEGFESLDVMEYVTNTPQYLGGDQITWEHRILQRRGKLTEYHHLGFWRNGSRYPENKLLMGRLFRNEALVQLQPLEIELDETYRYTYLGSEEIDGHASHRIRFEPTREGSREDGTLVRGEVWLDEGTFAHRRVRTYQEGLDGRLVYQERTYHYEWLAQNGQCFWDWRLREGTYAGASLGKSFQVSTMTRREDFKYNRPDIEQVATRAYEGDVMIHVETPPEGHRWLVKLEGERRLARRPDEWESYPVEGLERDGVVDWLEAEKPEVESEFTGHRVLADVDSFSTRASFSVGGFGSSGESVDLFPGLVLTDQDLFGRGYFGYLGLFKDELRASISLPSLFGGKALLTGSLDLPYDEDQNYQIRAEGPPAAGEPGGFDIDIYSPALTLALALPLRRSLTLDLSYTLRSLNFDGVGGIDFSNYVLPDDTDEHVIDAELGWRWRRLQLAVGLEAGRRSSWSAWGLDGSQEPKASYQVLRVQGFSSKSLRNDHTIAGAFSYFKGFDLDRFSRLPGGRSRGTVIGFSTTVGFDEAVFASVQYGASLWRRLPINLQLEGGLSRFDDFDWQERVGASFRFLINGPFKTDLWPSIRYTAYSSVPGEEGKFSYGLVIGRRY